MKSAVQRVLASTAYTLGKLFIVLGGVLGLSLAIYSLTSSAGVKLFDTLVASWCFLLSIFAYHGYDEGLHFLIGYFTPKKK